MKILTPVLLLALVVACGTGSRNRASRQSEWPEGESPMTVHPASGFTEVERRACGESCVAPLQGLDNPHWADQSLYVDARKSAGV